VIEKFHAQLLARRKQIEEQVFDSPPRDWAEFKGRLHAHIEVNTLINDIEAVMKGREDDQP
jgi:hypothetical protein